MRVLILCSRLQVDGSSPWLIDDLAEAMRARGVDVWVVVASPSVPRPRGVHSPREGLTVVSVGVEKQPRGRPARVSAMARAALRVRRAVKDLAREHTFDAVIFPSIGLLYARAAELLPVSTRRLFVLWDFFPTHHAQVGSLPHLPLLEPALKRLERWSIGHPDTVMVMSPAGETFFRAYHEDLAPGFAILPPWSSDTSIRAELPAQGPLRVVFGGQLAKGRGVDIAIRAAALLRDADESVELVIAGGGPEELSLRTLADTLDAYNVAFVGLLDRVAYAALLRSAHAGLAVTQADVTSPSFPSKIGDYARAGLPVIVATESTSDVGRLIEEAGAGLSVDTRDPRALADAMRSLVSLRDSGALRHMGISARRLFESHLSADAAADVLIGEVLGRKSPGPN